MKSRIGILTDNTAQFTTENFSGRSLVNIISFEIDEMTQNHVNESDDTLKPTIKPGKQYQISTPSEDIIRDTIKLLEEQYNEIIVLVISSQINPLYFLLEKAINKYGNAERFHLIDTQTISIGLGLLVQISASSAYRGFPIDEIKKNIRCLIPKIYSVYCVKNLSFLYFSGLMDPAQAVIGDLLGISPCLLMENGRFIPTHKCKNFRHTNELFLEFISEFENLRNIALLYGDEYNTEDFQFFRSRVNHQFSTASFFESRINHVVAALLGPQTTGIVLMDKI